LPQAPTIEEFIRQHLHRALTCTYDDPWSRDHNTRVDPYYLLADVDPIGCNFPDQSDAELGETGASCVVAMLRAAMSLACKFTRIRPESVHRRFGAFGDPDDVRISELGSYSSALELWHKLMTSSPFENVSAFATHEVYECCVQDESGVGHQSPIQSWTTSCARIPNRFTQDELSPDHIGWTMRQALHYDIEPGVSRRCETEGCDAGWATRWSYTANRGPQILTFEFECNHPNNTDNQRINKRITPPPILNIGNAFWREMNGPAHSRYELHCVIFCHSSASSGCRYSVATLAWEPGGGGRRKIDDVHSQWAPDTAAPCIMCDGTGGAVSGEWVIDDEPFGPSESLYCGESLQATQASGVHRGSWQDVLHKLGKQVYMVVYTRCSVQLPVSPRPMTTVFNSLRSHVRLYKQAVQHTLHTATLAVAASFQSNSTLSSGRGCPVLASRCCPFEFAAALSLLPSCC
jgi:hypothetical protein